MWRGLSTVFTTLDNQSAKERVKMRIGYPGSVGLIASRAPNDVRRELFKFPTTATDEIAASLAEHSLIQPVVTQTRVTAQTGGKTFYDTVNTFGNVTACDPPGEK